MSSEMDKELVKVDDELKKKLFDRMMDLEYKIAVWGYSNSQSNPGAMMDLRDMKKKVKRIQEILGFK